MSGYCEFLSSSFGSQKMMRTSSLICFCSLTIVQPSELREVLDTLQSHQCLQSKGRFPTAAETRPARRRDSSLPGVSRSREAACFSLHNILIFTGLNRHQRPTVSSIRSYIICWCCSAIHMPRLRVLGQATDQQYWVYRYYLAQKPKPTCRPTRRSSSSLVVGLRYRLVYLCRELGD